MKTPLKPPSFMELLASELADEARRERYLRSILLQAKPTVEGRYRHWDALRHMAAPEGLTTELWWASIKAARSQILRDLPLTDANGNPFRFGYVAPALAMLHTIDQDAAGQIALSETVVTPDSRRRYLVSSLIEESITSSQLEGAATSRRVAKEMLRSGRAPRSKSELMIVNNYRAMNLVRDHASTPLSPEFVLTLHKVLTEGTLRDPASAGRMQGPDEERVAVFDEEGNLLHRPPPPNELPERLRAMCAFANSVAFGDEYLHPVVRAIILHFWVGHDHPFEDGNGRTARALFYWAMLRQGYWLTEYLTISTVLRRAPAKYARAFLYTESDDNDLTYFVLNQLDVVVRSIDALKAYLERKMHEVQQTEVFLQTSNLNYRQIALLGHALRHPDAEYTFRSHATSHHVVYQSARTDLLSLSAKGYLNLRLHGRTYVFRPAPDLADRVQAGAGSGQRLL